MFDVRLPIYAIMVFFSSAIDDSESECYGLFQFSLWPNRTKETGGGGGG